MEQDTARHVASASASAEPPPTVKPESSHTSSTSTPAKPKARRRRKPDAAEEEDASKRRCVSNACEACRGRKSKCDGSLPACAACLNVYGTQCIYAPHTDLRRKGVYRNADLDNPKNPRNSTLQTLITALLNLQEEEAFDLVREIRACESLDAVAEKLASKEDGTTVEDKEDTSGNGLPPFEKHFYDKMGDLRLEEGSVRYIGGTSHLIHTSATDDDADDMDDFTQQENPVTSWTTVSDDPDLIQHLLRMYFCWHYQYFTCLSKQLFYRDFALGYSPHTRRKTRYCTPLLVNAMLALGCHFTSHKGAREDPEDSATAGDHFFREAKRLMLAGDFEIPRLTTVQAIALMSVREAGCAREAKGWVYSGMSFRMLAEMGLQWSTGQLTKNKHVNGDEAEEDVRRITFWGCFQVDKCWSNYLGRLPQLKTGEATVPKFEVFPDEEASEWLAYTDSGFSQAHAQPSRTRAVALEISKLSEISNDLMFFWYNPSDMGKNRGKAAELKMLSSIHTRLETWRRELPKEFEPREGILPSVIVMHMWFQVLFLHTFKPFLRYNQATSPLPQTVSPRKLCTQAAQMISKLMRLYKRSFGLRQIPNITVYILHSACTIHFLNLPEKNSKRDIVHGLKHLEEIAEGWLCARRTLGILSSLARKWKVELPEEAALVLERTDAKFGYVTGASPPPRNPGATPDLASIPQAWPQMAHTPNGYTNHTSLSYQPGAVRATPAVNSPAQQYPPPASSSAQDSHGPSLDTRTTTSPSGMFGGIEQLMRESQDWVMRDQAQLATGFDNWSGVDPMVWGNGVAPVGGQGQVGGPFSTVSSAPMGGGVSMGAALSYPAEVNGHAVMDEWLYGVNAAYNGDEMSWYQ